MFLLRYNTSTIILSCRVCNLSLTFVKGMVGGKNQVEVDDPPAPARSTGCWTHLYVDLLHTICMVLIQPTSYLKVYHVSSLFYLRINPSTAQSYGRIVSSPPVATVVTATTVAPTAKAQAMPAAATGPGRAVHVVDGTLRARNRR